MKIEARIGFRALIAPIVFLAFGPPLGVLVAIGVLKASFGPAVFFAFISSYYMAGIPALVAGFVYSATCIIICRELKLNTDIGIFASAFIGACSGMFGPVVMNLMFEGTLNASLPHSKGLSFISFLAISAGAGCAICVSLFVEYFIAPSNEKSLTVGEVARMTTLASSKDYLTEPYGLCPRCQAAILLMAPECPNCDALFGDFSTWKPTPLTKAAAAQLINGIGKS